MSVIHMPMLEGLRMFPDNHFDSVICDPPYGLKFMGKHWDYDVPTVEEWREVLRVVKPGGYLLAFGGTRTYHRLVCGIEDAGFRIITFVAWVYGSGMPKGTDKAKIPEEWAGWNTALKPAIEPVCLARKAPVGTLANNLATYGVGAMNIAGCRVGNEVRHAAFTSLAPCTGNRLGAAGTSEARRGTQGEAQEYVGRWPATVITDGSEEVIAAFPNAPGQLAAESFSAPSNKSRNTYAPRGRRPGGFGNVGAEKGDSVPNGPMYSDSGSAARFFYAAKASASERTAGGVANGHPTLKPVALMRYLCRLVTPPGGTVCDPWAGSGSTGVAAVAEGFGFIGFEREAEYATVANARIAHARGAA